MPDKFAGKISKSIPAKYLSWIFSLLGGSALVMFWSYLDQSKQIGLMPPPAGPTPSVQPVNGSSAAPGAQVGQPASPAPVGGSPPVPPTYYGDDGYGEDYRGEWEYGDEGEGYQRPPSGAVGGAVPVPMTPSPTPAPSSPPPSTPPASQPPSGGVVAGIYKDGVYKASSNAPWGVMGIEVTVSGGKWTAIKTPSIPDSPPSYYAVTYLVQQALAAQSAQIVGVSGATYTSNAFRDDLRQIVQLSKR